MNEESCLFYRIKSLYIQFTIERYMAQTASPRFELAQTASSHDYITNNMSLMFQEHTVCVGHVAVQSKACGEGF